MGATPVLHLIGNRRSGRGEAGTVAELAKAACERAGVRFVEHSVDDPSQLTQVAKQAVEAARQDGGTVAISGGDGSVRSVADVVADTGVPMAVIPSGTFNYFAREHGIPETLEDAVEVAVTGRPTPATIGRVNGELFLVNASIGLYAAAIRNRERSTERFGRRRIVVIISTLLTMLQLSRGLRVAIERGGVLVNAQTPTLVVGVNALQLRALDLDVCRCVEDERLAVMVLRPVEGIFAVLKLLFMTAIRKLSDTDRLAGFCADELTVHRGKRYCTVALDGELRKLKSPLKFTAHPRTVVVRVPEPQPDAPA